MTRSQAEKDALERMQAAIPPLNSKEIGEHVYETCYHIKHLLGKLDSGKSWTKQGSVEHLLLTTTIDRLGMIYREIEAVEEIANKVIDSCNEAESEW